MVESTNIHQQLTSGGYVTMVLKRLPSFSLPVAERSLKAAAICGKIWVITTRLQITQTTESELLDWSSTRPWYSTPQKLWLSKIALTKHATRWDPRHCVLGIQEA